MSVALITGASRGIGRGIALALAGAGFNIVGTATKADPAETQQGLYEVKAKCEALGVRFVPVAGNIATRTDHGAVLDAAYDSFGRIDCLVNNAGVAPLQRLDILETSEESFDRLMNINLRGPFFFTQAAAQRMLAQPKIDTPQSIIFVTSISADTASPNRAEYCISKAGLAMAAQNFAVRLAPSGIHVYELRPGIIATDMTAGVKEKYDGLIGGGLLLEPRWGTPEDIGRAVATLATDSLPYAPGAVIEIGGGFGVRRL